MKIENSKKTTGHSAHPFQFAAIDPVSVTSVPAFIEQDSGRGWVNYGSDNGYPNFLLDLYDSVPILSGIINGCADYVTGEGVDLGVGVDIDLTDLIHNLAIDYYLFGGFCIEVLRDMRGEVTMLNYVPFDRVRTNEYKDKFYYSPDWSKKANWRVKYTEVPTFDPNGTEPRSFYYYSHPRIGTYPTPIWNSAIKSAVIYSRVTEYHLNGLSNGFNSSAIISFNNGVPEDDQKREIEKYFTEKFCGSTNTGRVVLSFAPDKEHSAEINTLTTEDYSTKYTNCIEKAREDLFVAFRATSNLFGLQKENVGFNTQEYDSSFRLFNRTVIAPTQRIFERAILYTLGVNASIEPFVISFDNEPEVK